MIYLASPYTHPDPHVREQRYYTVCYAAAKLINEGHNIYSPIAHTHGICEQMRLRGIDEHKFEFWSKMDKEMIRLCDRFWVLRMEGWEQSEGIKAELAYAMSIGRDPYYL